MAAKILSRAHRIFLAHDQKNTLGTRTVEDMAAENALRDQLDARQGSVLSSGDILENNGIFYRARVDIDLSDPYLDLDQIFEEVTLSGMITDELDEIFDTL